MYTHMRLFCIFLIFCNSLQYFSYLQVYQEQNIPCNFKYFFFFSFQSVLEVSSNLLDDSQRLPWQDLNKDQQQKSASALLRSQEKSGWLLAESHHSRYSLRSGQPHVCKFLVYLISSFI